MLLRVDNLLSLGVVAVSQGHSPEAKGRTSFAGDPTGILFTIIERKFALVSLVSTLAVFLVFWFMVDCNIYMYYKSDTRTKLRALNYS